MTFAHPLWLLLLLALPLWAWAARRRGPRAALAYPSSSLVAGVPPTAWARLRRLPGWLRIIALALGIVALARPQLADTVRTRSAEGIDIVLVLDLSTSMLAQDVFPNRFEAARRVAAEFIDGRTSDRIGLVVFAAQAYTQAPLTLDYAFLKRMLGEIRMGLIEDGTAIGTGLVTATARLRDSDAPGKVVILLTDGQNNRGEVDPATAAEAAQALGVRVYTVGVGGAGSFEARSGPGGRLEPEVDEVTLQAVARTTGGRYYRATDAEALRQIYASISDIERTEVEDAVYVDVEEAYPWALWPAFVLLLAGLALETTRLRRVP